MNRVARDPIYDFLKGVMMLLIIGGHLVGLKVIAPTVKEGVSYFSNFCIAVEMPVFFIISGYFARKTLDDRNIWKILSNLANFIWPMISFGWLFGLILWLAGSIDFMAMVKYPIVMARGLWFLRVLFWVYLLSAVICYFARPTWMRGILFRLPTWHFFSIPSLADIGLCMRNRICFHFLSLDLSACGDMSGTNFGVLLFHAELFS